MILAKPVVDKQYWILKQDDRKVGNIVAGPDGYQVTIRNRTSSYKTIPMLSRQEQVEFQKLERQSRSKTNQVHGYEVDGRVYNPIWDVKHRLPLFTRDNKSKSWYAAGWYSIKQHRNWKQIQNPKLITLQRYAYQGPFHSEQEAYASQN
jgi:hypothetical protein